MYNFPDDNMIAVEKQKHVFSRRYHSYRTVLSAGKLYLWQQPYPVNEGTQNIIDDAYKHEE